MTLPPPRRRVKFAPQYIGVALQPDRVIVPKDIKSNDEVLRNLRDPANASNNKQSKSSLRVDSESSENDSEASTSEEDALTEFESELETDHEEDHPAPIPEQPSPVKVNNNRIEHMDLELDFTDLVLEHEFESLSENWSKKELAEGRRIIYLDRGDDDNAVSIWPTESTTTTCCPISCLLDAGSGSFLLSLYDLQRLIAFVADKPLSDSKKKRLQKLLDWKQERRLLSPDDALLAQFLNIKTPPKPFVRRTSPSWVVAWDKVEAILIDVFEAEGACVTVLS